MREKWNGTERERWGRVCQREREAERERQRERKRRVEREKEEVEGKGRREVRKQRSN